MKVVVKMPISVYRALEAKRGDTSAVMRLLKSGLIDEQQSYAVIRCEGDDAFKLCALANDCFRDAARHLTIVPDE
jgi:hypothetical protein